MAEASGPSEIPMRRTQKRLADFSLGRVSRHCSLFSLREPGASVPHGAMHRTRLPYSGRGVARARYIGAPHPAAMSAPTQRSPIPSTARPVLGSASYPFGWRNCSIRPRLPSNPTPTVARPGKGDFRTRNDSWLFVNGTDRKTSVRRSYRAALLHLKRTPLTT